MGYEVFDELFFKKRQKKIKAHRFLDEPSRRNAAKSGERPLDGLVEEPLLSRSSVFFVKVDVPTVPSDCAGEVESISLV